MKTIDYIHTLILPAAFALLPDEMNTPNARAMMLSIGSQESDFKYRLQLGGPAHGFWQFERGGGVTGVLSHLETGPIIRQICETLRVTPTPLLCHAAIADNDPLAACFARLNLRTDPRPLPGPTQAEDGWNYYLRVWRPGKPHRNTWDAYYKQAWEMVQG